MCTISRLKFYPQIQYVVKIKVLTRVTKFFRELTSTKMAVVAAVAVAAVVVVVVVVEVVVVV